MLLQQAEDLLGILGRDRRRQLMLRGLQGAVVPIPALALIALGAPLVAVTAVVLTVILVVLAEVYTVRPAARKRDRHQAEVTNRVDELREVFVHLAKKEHWSADRVRDTRSRLARFSVEERGGLW